MHSYIELAKAVCACTAFNQVKKIFLIDDLQLSILDKKYIAYPCFLVNIYQSLHNIWTCLRIQFFGWAPQSQKKKVHKEVEIWKVKSWGEGSLSTSRRKTSKRVNASRACKWLYQSPVAPGGQSNGPGRGSPGGCQTCFGQHFLSNSQAVSLGTDSDKVPAHVPTTGCLNSALPITERKHHTWGELLSYFPCLIIPTNCNHKKKT